MQLACPPPLERPRHVETAAARADVVIIGGGIVGTSIAYHLAKIGITNVVLLERKQLTSRHHLACGRTCRAVARHPQSDRACQIHDRAVRRLEKETGQATGFKQNGSISVALTDGRIEELKRGASMAQEVRSRGRRSSRPARSRSACRIYNLEGAVGGVFLPKDGQVNPIDVTQALAAGARSRGAKIFENTKVTRILVDKGKAVGVETAEGTIAADRVVIAAGMWSREHRPRDRRQHPAPCREHFYIVTEPIAELPRNMPVVRVPDECTYYKEDAGKLLIGAFEPKAKPWGSDGIAEDHAFETLPEDMDHFEPILNAAIARVPLLETGRHRALLQRAGKLHAGRPLLSRRSAGGRRISIVATGFNSIGIQSSGGAGLVLSQWIKNGHPPMDVSRRRHPPHPSLPVGQGAMCSDRTVESLGLLYAMHWPYRQAETARGVRRSPIHDRLKALGACVRRGQWLGAARTGMRRDGRRAGISNIPMAGRTGFPAPMPRPSRCRMRCRASSTSRPSPSIRVEGRDALKVLNRISRQ